MYANEAGAPRGRLALSLSSGEDTWFYKTRLFIQQGGPKVVGTLMFSRDDGGTLVWVEVDGLSLPRYSWGTTAQCEDK